MGSRLDGKRVAFLMANEGVERIELEEPLRAVRGAGATVELIAPEAGTIQTFDHLDKAETYTADRAVGDADPGDYDAVVVPGGVANPDALRQDADAVRFLKEIVGAGKPAGLICHAPWMLVEADLVRGRTVTSWPSLQTDIRNAGGEWVDEEVVVDSGLVTSRKPDDLPAFCAKVVEEVAEGRHTEQARKAGARA